MKALIVYANAGAGHRRAAEAAYGAFKRHGREKEVMLIDCLEYTNPFFKVFYPKVYISLVRFMPWLWAGIYYSLENRLIYALIKPLRRLNNMLVSGRFVKLLKDNNPQVVISTQFFASEIVAALKHRGKITSKLISVVTDFGAHTFWESPDVDIFVAASEKTRQDLLRRKIPDQKIKVLGIPIDPPIKNANQALLRKELNLKQDLFTFLIVGGGFGVGPIQEIVSSLNGLPDGLRDKLQLVVVCSSNKILLQQMRNMLPGLKLSIKVMGFVPSLYEMMAASDIIISKSGGLTSSESVAQGVPMIIISPIPGQEMKNCRYLVENGAAFEINRPFEIQGVVKQLLNEPDKIKQMSENAARLAHPDSAEAVFALAANYIGPE